MEPKKNEPRPDANGMMPSEKEAKKPPFSVKTTFWLIIILLAVLVVLMGLMMVRYSQPLAAVFVVLIFAFVFLNKGCWKCPACRKHLGRFGRLKECPHCGEKLDI